MVMTIIATIETRRRQRRVVALAEQRLDHVADHDAVGAADERRRDVVADRRDEDEQAGGDDAGHRQRQGDAQEALDAVVAEVLPASSSERSIFSSET